MNIHPNLAAKLRFDSKSDPVCPFCTVALRPTSNTDSLRCCRNNECSHVFEIYYLPSDIKYYNVMFFEITELEELGIFYSITVNYISDTMEIEIKQEDSWKYLRKLIIPIPDFELNELQNLSKKIEMYETFS